MIKQNYLFFAIPLFLLLFSSCSDQQSEKRRTVFDTVAQQKMLQKLEVFLADTNIIVENRFKINFDLSNGKNDPDSSGYMEMIQTTDSVRNGTTTWITYFKSGKIEMTGRTAWNNEDTLGFPDWADTIGVSQNSKYLSIETHDAESDVFIEVADLKTFILQKKIRTVFSINPYPGITYFKKWEGNKILFSADINVLGLNQSPALSEADEFRNGEKEKDFLFDPETKLFSMVK